MWLICWLCQESYVWKMYQERCWEFFPVGDCFRKQYEDQLGWEEICGIWEAPLIMSSHRHQLDRCSWTHQITSTVVCALHGLWVLEWSSLNIYIYICWCMVLILCLLINCIYWINWKGLKTALRIVCIQMKRYVLFSLTWLSPSQEIACFIGFLSLLQVDSQGSMSQFTNDFINHYLQTVE